MDESKNNWSEKSIYSYMLYISINVTFKNCWIKTTVAIQKSDCFYPCKKGNLSGKKHRAIF